MGGESKVMDDFMEYKLKPCSQHEHMESKVEKLNKTVYGNGDPTKSLVFQMAKLNDKLTLNNWLTSFLVITIVGAILKGILF